jgi:uncharacterized membrane protein HdeD (DUF308 family)
MATPTNDPVRQEHDEAAAVRQRISRRLGDVWWAFMARGLLAVAIGLGVLVWPTASLEILLMLVGLYCLIDGAANLVAVFRGGERDIHLIQALLGLTIGAALLFWPGISIRGLLIVFGTWVLFTGASQVVAARRIDLESDERGAMTAVGAIIAIAGLVLMVWPGSGVVLIGWLIAFATLAVAALLVFVALRLKRLRERLDARASAGAGR